MPCDDTPGQVCLPATSIQPLTPSPPLPHQTQTTPRLETPSPPSPANPKRLLVLEGKRSNKNLALELQRENEGARRSGPPDPHRFQGGERSIKMHFCRGSAAASQQSHHCLVYTAAAHSPASGHETGCRHGAGMRGPGPLTAPETLLCLPTLPLFKNKTKSPTPPSALQHPRHQGGQTVAGGHSICRHYEEGLPEDSQ